jgi:predicted homoserine dehydrogenase-like protein
MAWRFTANRSLNILGEISMILVDQALRQREAEKRPIRVALVGAGFMARGVASQILKHVSGMRLAVVVNRTLQNAASAYTLAGVNASRIQHVTSRTELDEAIASNTPAITTITDFVCASDSIDIVLEATGHIGYSAHVVLEAIAHRKPIVTLTAELDATLGPILRHKADAASVMYCVADGDQPAVEMNLYRAVKAYGLTPLVCGNVKGFLSLHHTPDDVRPFAERTGQSVNMVCGFADGTKVSMEQAVVANATGMTVAKRGMSGLPFTGHIDELVTRYDVAELRRLGGIVDYIVGAKPTPGVFVLAACDDPHQLVYLDVYKLGRGPLYNFYTPYHLCHLEAPMSVARVLLFGDAPIQPRAGIGPNVEVVATTKSNLRAGTVLDGIGGYSVYGQCETASITLTEGLLPVGVAEGCRLVRDVPVDHVLTYADVELPANRLLDGLRLEQARLPLSTSSIRTGTDAPLTQTPPPGERVAPPAVAMPI